MRKYLCFLAIVLFTFLSALPAGAANVFKNYEKVIWIDQGNQTGAAYEKGQKLYSFPIMSGDDETPTPPGAYVVRVKDANYFSHKYKQPMSYSLFFDFKAKRAIHEGVVAAPEERNLWATHGCIHVEQPYMKRLFDWADKGKTLVVVRGRRDWNLPDQVGEVDEEIRDTGEDQENQEGEETPKVQESPKSQENHGNQEPQPSRESQGEESSGPEPAPDQPE